MTLVFQIAWGGLFVSIFGDSLGVLRAATVTFAGIGGLAMYALCRELRVTLTRSAFGAAVFLFNPISFALAYTRWPDRVRCSRSWPPSGPTARFAKRRIAEASEQVPAAKAVAHVIAAMTAAISAAAIGAVIASS